MIDTNQYVTVYVSNDIALRKLIKRWNTFVQTAFSKSKNSYAVYHAGEKFTKQPYASLANTNMPGINPT